MKTQKIESISHQMKLAQSWVDKILRRLIKQKKELKDFDQVLTDTKNWNKKISKKLAKFS